MTSGLKSEASVAHFSSPCDGDYFFLSSPMYDEDVFDFWD